MRELASPSPARLNAAKYGLIVAAIMLATVTVALGIYAHLATAGIDLTTVR